MTLPVYDRNNQRVDVDETEAMRGFTEGRYTLSGKVPVRLRDGSIGSVDAAEAQAVLESGGVFATPEEFQEAEQAEQYGNDGATARAGLEGAARGLTFGLSDVAIAGIGGDEAANDARLRRQYSPSAALGGEIAGAVLPLLIPGAGEANAARILAEGANVAREASTVARAGETLASAGRAVGALPRAAAALGDAGATGGRLAAEALGMTGTSAAQRLGRAALTEAGRGVVEGGLQGLGGAISEVALGETPDIRADRILTHVGMGALLGGVASGVLGSGGELMRMTGSSLRSLVPDMGSTALRNQAAQARLEAAGVWGKSNLDRVRQRSGGLQGAADDLDRLRIGNGPPGSGGLSERANLPTAQNALVDAERLEIEAGKKFAEFGSRMDEAVAAAGNGYRDAAAGAMGTGRVDVRPLIAQAEEMAAKMRRAPSGGTEVADQLMAHVTPLRAHMETGLDWRDALQQRQLWDAQINSWGKDLSGSAVRPQEQLRTLRGLIKEQLGATADRANLGDLWSTANREFGIAKMITGAAGANRLSEIGGIGGAVATGIDLATAGAGFAAYESGNPLAFPLAMLGSVGHRLAAQEVRRFTPAIKARALQFLARAADSTSTNIGQAALGIVANRAARTVRSGVPVATVKAYEAAVRNIRETTPETVVRRVGDASAGLLETAPDTHTAVVQRALRAHAFLVQRVPVTDALMQGDIQPGLHRSRPVSETERRRFMALQHAVENPSSIIAAIKDKSVTADQVDVLREVYPALYQEIRTSTMQAIAESKTPIDYNSRLRLGILLGAPTDPSLVPSTLAALQGQFVTPELAAPPASQPVNSRSVQIVASEVDSFEARRARS